MKICLIHNEYGKLSGEEIVVNSTIELLREKGHDVTYFQRSSAEIPEMRFEWCERFSPGFTIRSLSVPCVG